MSELGENQKIITGTKEDSRTIRWLLKGASRDPARYEGLMTGILIHNGAAITTDGTRVFAASLPPSLQDHDGEVLAGKVPAGAFTAVMEDLQAEAERSVFPDIYGVIRDADEPVFQIRVNPKLLREALEGADRSVRLVFYGDDKPMELYGRDKSENDTYVILMPMHPGSRRERGWRPQKVSEEQSGTQESEKKNGGTIQPAPPAA